MAHQILVVDNDFARQQMLAARLKGVAGLVIDAVCDSEAAITGIRADGLPDLVIANVGNPRSRHSNAADILGQCPGVRLVVVTGCELDEELRARHAGAVAFIGAPLPDDFVEQVRCLLSG